MMVSVVCRIAWWLLYLYWVLIGRGFCICIGCSSGQGMRVARMHVKALTMRIIEDTDGANRYSYSRDGMRCEEKF